LRAGIPAVALYIAVTVERDQRLDEIRKLAGDAEIPVLDAGRGELDRLAGGAVHQGVVLTARPFDYLHPDDLLRRAQEASSAPLLVALDGVTDPHNLGACLRCADAFGAQAVIVPKDRAAGVNATVEKAASGAAETVPLIAVTNLARTMRELKARDVWLLGADQGGESLYGADVSGAIAWVLGAEGQGLRRLTRETCDRLIGIPMQGAVESLNVSVTAGICLYSARAARSRSS
jgi:23S rRNA (guanosine2251-2'-O)-methyltransferase